LMPWVLCQILHSGRVSHHKGCACFCLCDKSLFFSLRVTNQQMCWLCLFVCVLVPVAFTSYNAYRSGLSTLYSVGNLNRNLILKQASRLDAFSGYPFRT